MGKNSIEFKAFMDLEQVAGYLNDLAAGIKDGCICVQKGEETAVLRPTEQVRVEIEAKEKRDKCKFSLELTWVKEIAAVDESSDLKISSTPPPEPVPEETGAVPEPEKPEEPEDPAITSYKAHKKKMKKSFKTIRELLEQSQMPPLELVEQFYTECLDMPNHSSEAEKEYNDFRVRVEAVVNTARAGDSEAFAAAISELRESTKACHEKFKD